MLSRGTIKKILRTKAKETQKKNVQCWKELVVHEFEGVVQKIENKSDEKQNKDENTDTDED